MTSDGGILDHVAPEDAAFIQKVAADLDTDAEDALHVLVTFLRVGPRLEDLSEKEAAQQTRFCEIWSARVRHDLDVRAAMRKLKNATGDGAIGADGREDGLGERGDSP